MPYASVSELPEHIKKLSSTKQRQFMHVFNSCMSEGNEESRCFAMANGVLNKDVSIHAGAYRVMADGSFGKAIKSFAELLGLTPKTPPVSTGLVVTKQEDGRLRWFARYSNAWEDRDKEIITEAAHRDYIQWATSSKAYPELWLWHTKGTSFGEADWLDFSDGFAHASGLIDEDKEHVVEELATKDLGVSHGFLCSQDGKYINKYRTFEISVLPRERAAVWTADFNVLGAGKETIMAFTDERRAWLVEALGEDVVKELEKNTSETANQLKQLGVEYKAAEDAAAEQAESAQTEGFKALATQLTELTGVVTNLATAVAAIKIDLGNTKEALDDVKKSNDEKIEDAFLAKVAKAFGQNGGFRASESGANTVTEKEASEAGANTSQDDFLGQMLTQQFGDLSKIGAGATGAVKIS